MKQDVFGFAAKHMQELLQIKEQTSQRIENLEYELDEARLELESVKIRECEYLTRIMELEGAVGDKAALVVEYKGKIEIIGSIAKMLDALKEQRKPD
jgi:hypothetical protein